MPFGASCGRTTFIRDGSRWTRICTDCPVGEQCLEYALEQRIEHGVWGGCSERERRRILKRRRNATSVSIR